MPDGDGRDVNEGCEEEVGVVLSVADSEPLAEIVSGGALVREGAADAVVEALGRAEGVAVEGADRDAFGDPLAGFDAAADAVERPESERVAVTVAVLLAVAVFVDENVNRVCVAVALAERVEDLVKDALADAVAFLVSVTFDADAGARSVSKASASTWRIIAGARRARARTNLLSNRDL